MAEYLSTPVKIGGVIPHFFYDAIGRIVPGAYLIAGMVTAGWYQAEALRLLDTLDVAELVVAFLFLLCISYFLGFLLGAVSYHLVESWPFFEHYPWGEWTVQQVREWYGYAGGEETVLEGVFQRELGFKIQDTSGNDQSKRISHCSWLCSYFVWAKSYSLGVLASRWDAEALSARSICVASLPPFVYSLTALVADFLCSEDWLRDLVLSLVFLGIGSVALLAYSYHRRKQLFGRFDLFLALVGRSSREQPTTLPAE